MKKLVAAALAFVLAVSGSPALATDVWVPSEPQEPAGFNFATDSMGRNGLTHFLIREPGGNGQSLVYYRADSGEWHQCPAATSSLDCDTGKVGEIQGSSMLPVCSAVIESCIEKVWIYSEGQPEQEATYKKTVDGWNFKGVPSKGVPTGSAVSIWESPLQHTGGNGNYSVTALLNFHARPSRIEIDGLDLKIAPVNEVADPQARVGTPYICTPPNGGPKKPCGSTVGGLSEGNCIYMQEKTCALAQVPAENSRFGLQLILHNNVTGWFRGRVSDPNISVTKINAMYNRVVIHANPVDVPKLSIDLNTKEGDPDFWKLFPSGIHLGGGYGGAESATATTIKMVDLARKKATDKATAVTSLWAFNTISGNVASMGQNRCLQDNSRLLGIVTTNAMAYVGTAPKWSNGFLSYDVSGMHYLPDGSLALGTYDLVMRSDVARCLYGFSKAPLSATVSVVNEKGTKTTATTVVSEKNGWLKMAAYGFTFSKKTIKVKITKKKK